MKNAIFLLLIITIFSSCKEQTTPSNTVQAMTAIPKGQLPEWAKTSTIYEVNIRQYTPQGTINAFSDHIPRLKEMGIEILWLMPVYPISTDRKKGTLGSYYAVSDYTEVNPAFGTKEDLINLIDKIHAYKMKVILDWVPNHTGWNHKWIKEHPEYYTKDSSGQITDPIDSNTGQSFGWTDVADLNYDNPEMRKAMIQDLVYWVKDHGIDGYRMDIAFGVPLDFWHTLSDTLYSINPDLFLLAESEDPAHLNEEVFHACYSWNLHHIMNDIANGKKTYDDIKKWRSQHASQFVKGNLMHFITNHDENSWNGSEIERMGDAYMAFAAFVHTLDGIPLVYSGQEEPLQKRLEFFEKDDIGFKSYGMIDFYQKLIKVKKENPALYNRPYGGAIEVLADHPDIYAIKRVKDNNTVYVLINLSNQDRKIALNEPIEGARELLDGGIFNLPAGQECPLKPWQFVIAIKNNI